MNPADPSTVLRTEPATQSIAGEFLKWVRIISVAGVATGLLIVGVGSRLAMLLLRFTSDDSVRGRLSDDGFVIGRFGFGDTYGLVQLGVLVGMIGATTYLLLRRWLIGPRWLHAVTIGLASGAVGGSMLLHADGVDFLVLGPRWLAISLFIALPAVFGAAIGPAVEAAEAAERRGPGRWSRFVVALLLGPAALLSYVFVVPVLFLYSSVRMSPPMPQPLPGALALLARAFWLGIALLGLFALIADIQEILDLPPPA